MASAAIRQQDQALNLLRQKGMVRLAEFNQAGVAATTISRMEKAGLLVKLSRGVYRLPDAVRDTHHSLAEAAKLVPKGVICLVSALAFHELTDAIPSRVWIAINSRDWKPNATHLPLEIVRFSARLLNSGNDTHLIDGVTVRITNPAKTIVDMFRYRQSEGVRYRQSPGLNRALEGMREALRQRKATPANIARYAEEAGIWKIVQPYLEAMTANA
ncbi:type IV toxin-antitoxin system AbiEi family antitoxin domain-containing protein [Roseiarcaceae bacterium H3SJ34-1]|uniref:type IV toxin-antitoxin system AbiEi family antitoxin domain-containing protein n=1 Tax=Terripilifer ovatus TaxID=3032367 RepID=UPI003AB98986|nr:type IV toxin-antitoxin system AbiEi family antitoxin domain-containing protein [Roseiarcaceae bacterium H3SJ34-1]